MKNIQESLFIRACRREPTERTPVWIMRQAGRYLPEYRMIREKADFLKLCRTPELACEVTLQPVKRLGVDAAIIFSDILVIPEAMGMPFQIHEGNGPVFLNPLRSEADAKKLQVIDPGEELKYVLDAVRLTKQNLPQDIPLIGFGGSPWTLLTYMVEGGSSKNFFEIKKLIYTEPRLAHAILEKISEVVAQYLSLKIKNGVDAVQIFDTWGGILAEDEYREFSLRYISKVLSLIKRDDEPVIIYAKGVHHSLEMLANCGCQVISIDWAVNIGKVREQIGYKVALQGNLDPHVLLSKPDCIKSQAGKILKSYGKGEGHIFNLGHGILPTTPVEHAKLLVDFVKEESLSYHNAYQR